MNYLEFISAEKSLLKAPAGYGKTYTLAECIKYCPDNQKQLILTHTNAGIASINEKLRELEIDSSKCHINTICGFAQKYVLSLCNNSDLPPQENKQYFEAVVEKAIALFNLESVKRIVKCSYDGLFVDEYQDCSKSQHNMIMALAEVLPTHILGDPMQGIFNFNGTLVDIDHDLKDIEYQLSLDTPWRWRKEGNNNELGECLKEIRTVLDSENKEIDLNNFHKKGLFYYQFPEKDIYNPNTDYSSYVRGIITNDRHLEELESLLILVPNVFTSSSIESRAGLKARIDFKHQLTLLEAIDEKNHYDVCIQIDRIVETINDFPQKIKELNESIFTKLFNKTELKKWFSKNRLIRKANPNRDNYLKLKNLLDSFFKEPSVNGLYDIIQFMKDDLRLRSLRVELLNSILRALNTAVTEKITVYEAMKQQKNRLRHVGRKIYGKCLGTTLLTKGLEFDTVVILNAHQFDSYKHFYVAITRACKKLIIFSEKPVLNFN